MTALHSDELEIDEALARRLVAWSFPQYADLAVEPLPSSGSSNTLFRLGEQLLIRLPRQPGGSATIEKEARWLPVIAAGITTEVPQVVALGRPALGYPETWAVTKWLHGDVPTVPSNASAERTRELASDLAHFVTELHRTPVPPAAADDPDLSWYRGGRLAELDQPFRESLDACRAIPGLGLDLERALPTWENALAAEQAVQPVRGWYHGDLLAENLLVRDGRLAAVLDFGGLGIGDPTVDLIVAWEVLDTGGREVFRRAVKAGDNTWARSRGWALLIAMITFPYYWETMPSRCASRRAMAAAVLAED